MICEFIADHKSRFGVVPICAVLSERDCKIAPSTFYAWAKRPPSRRELWDVAVTEVLAGYYEPDEYGRRKPESLYGSLKMWAHLQRSHIPVARCTVERLMRQNGWQGVMRAKRVRTTIRNDNDPRPPDLVDRNFGAGEPNELTVADFTYVPMVSGYGYTAFVIDAYAGVIVGWECSLSKETGFVERAIRHACEYRRRHGDPIDHTIHHSDAGSQYTALRFGETLQLNGMIASIGSVADALDNALAETTIGLYKTECVRVGSPFRSGPFRRLGDLEEATSKWVHWYNNERLMHRLGRVPPAEYEAAYYTRRQNRQPSVHT